MNELREAFEAYLAGQSDLGTVERALHVSLAREPHLAAVHGAYIEALYRANRLSGEAYLTLVKMTRTVPASTPAPAAPVPEGDKTVLRAPKAPAAAAGGPGAGAEGEKTRFRMPAAPGGAQPSPPAPADATQLRARPAPGASAAPPDSTQLRARPAPGPSAAAGASAAPPDSTQLRARPAPGPSDAPPDATRLRARPAPVAGAAPAPSREAIAAGDPSWSPTTGSQSGPATGSFTGGTGSSTWSDANRWASAASVPLAVGSVIKERFVLEEELGRGGMGIVFKARDLRMEEAQDRNPFVAIKVLNDEFKRHPESLKALQREFRKAQSLAHPNVVTVGDFDRDGGNVFMTMELLEGEPLDQIIKRSANSGLEKRKALRITRDICRAMAYAHERGIVHSDFKPANAFLTRDGVVKVFDFGIARAAKRGDKATGTVTVFDAGTLGALTPAYASCEMIDGAEPDVRDDVYAMACVAYELLTGKHPFDRKSAAQARTAGLVPPRPAGLNRSQWRALKRGLAFRRERRSASAIELLNGLVPPKRSPAVYVGAGVSILAVAVLAIVLVPREIQHYRQQHWLAALRSGTAARIQAVLPALDRLTPTGRDAIFADRSARDGLIRYYNRKIRGAESRGDYLIAGDFANQLIGYLPDYADAQRISERVTSDTSDALERQSNRFDADLAAGRLIAAQGADNIEAVLAAVRRINPKGALLHDPRLPGAFAAQARQALERSDTALAQQLVTSGLAIAPANFTLRDLRDRVHATLLAQQTAARVAQLEQSLGALIDTHPALGTLDSHRADMTLLRTDAPGSAVLAKVQQYAQGEIEREVRGLEQQRQYPEAQSLLGRYADLASAAFIERQREALSAAQLTAEHKSADEARLREQRISELKARLAALLGRGPGSHPARWDAQLSQEQGALSAYLAPGDPYFAQVRSAAAAAYLKAADGLRASDRLTEAAQMLAHAQAYGLPAAELARENQLLAASRAQLAAAAQAQEQQAQTEALEQKLLVQADANTVNDALASLAALKARLPANDPFLTKEAPAAIGRGYLRLAASAALDGRFQEAQSLIAKGQATVPSFAPLGEAAQRYARYLALDREMASVDASSVDRVRAQIDQEERLAPREARALEHALARQLAVRLGAAPDAAAAGRLRALGHRLFPGDAQFAAAAAPAPSKPRAAAPRSAPAAVSSPPPAVPAAAPAAQVSAPQKTATTAPAPASQPVSLHDCANPELVGAGSNLRASCWDEIAGSPGPMLVVVPAPPGGQSFAIGRYDVSNADFARYCRSSGQCSAPAGSPALPVTSISIQAAEGYLHWLSRESGAVYRLPSAAEYVYAADAGSPGGQQLDADCEKSGVAASLLPVNSGDPNAWGLYNFDGDVQQWVRSGSELQARGGDYRDSFAQCKPGTARAQSGAPSAVTGFRVLREIK